MAENKQINVKKIKLLGQEYLVRTSSLHDMEEIAKYVDSKMDEVIKSGVDKKTQQHRIAIFACLEIAGELLIYKKQKLKLISEIENKSKLIIDSLDKKIKNIK